MGCKNRFKANLDNMHHLHKGSTDYANVFKNSSIEKNKKEKDNIHISVV